MKSFSSILLIFFLFSFNSGFSQDRKGLTRANSEPSFGVMMGWSVLDQLLPEGFDYNPLLIMGKIHYDLFTNRDPFHVKAYVEPQYNPVFLQHPIAPGSKMVEFGINAGLEASYNLWQNTLLIAAVGSGPHYINVETRQQQKGFIFSDNFILGINHILETHFSPIKIVLEFRYRHISNAGFKSPNRGIDNLFVVAGVSKQL